MKREQRRNERGVNNSRDVTREKNLHGKRDLLAKESAEHVSPVQADVLQMCSTEMSGWQVVDLANSPQLRMEPPFQVSEIGFRNRI